MKNRVFGLMTAIALSMIVTGGLWAQGMALSGWASAQSDATQGRIRSAADDFIRPDSYTSAGITNWFSMASFRTANGANLGYAKKLEKAYIGVYYGGTFWAGLEPFDYDEVRLADWPGGPRTARVYTDIEIDPLLDGSGDPTIHSKTNNHIALLLGVADMGFRLSYYSTHQFFSKNDIAIWDDSIAGGGNNDNIIDAGETTAYASYKTDRGLIRPQLAWSMAKNLTEKGIKPYVTFDLGFIRNYVKVEEAGSAAGEHVTTSENYVEPIFQLGLGGFTVVNKNNFRGSLDLEYRLTLRAYNNDLSYQDANLMWKTIKLKGIDGKELTYAENYIMPSFAGQWSNGPLALRFRVVLNTTIRGEKETNVERDGDKLRNDGTDGKTTTFALNPDFRLALQWRLIPKLALNAGGRINVQAWEVATTKGSVYMDGNELSDSSYKTVEHTYGDTARSLTVGVTFNPTDNLTFEACAGNSSGLASNRVNVFSNENDGLFNFGNILVSLKF